MMATNAKPALDRREALLREEAERLGIDPHAAWSGGLAAEVMRRWRVENEDALESSNAWVERHGLPLGHLRMF